jgi:peptidoglycan/xylan/chitin deacetylase (PgdA/CDA1 family)
MNLLRQKNYNVISLSRLISLLRKENGLPPKTVALTFDDGYADNYSTAYPILRQLGLPATIFIATDFIDRPGYLSWEQIREMEKSGLVESQPHTASHPKLPNLLPEEAEREIASSQRVLEEGLGRNCSLFAYPKGRFSRPIIEMVKRRFGAAVTVQSGFVGTKDDLYLLPRQAIDSAVGRRRFRLKI